MNANKRRININVIVKLHSIDTDNKLTMLCPKTGVKYFKQKTFPKPKPLGLLKGPWHVEK